MGNKVKKGFFVLTVTGGTMFAGLGCVGLSTVLTAATLYGALSLALHDDDGFDVHGHAILDNDAIFDVFGDGLSEDDSDAG